MDPQNYPSMDQYNYSNNGGNNNNSGYRNQAPQQHQQQQPQQGGGYPPQYNQGYQPQQQQQQYNPNQQYSPEQQGIGMQQRGGSGNEFLISSISSNPLAQVGFSYGQSLFNDGKQYVDSNIGKYFSFSSLKSYFNVNTSYVFNKIKLIIFPFPQKTWKRRIYRVGDVDSYLPPRDDINAPDLYIPLMAFVTYYLLYGFQLGMGREFSPDKLGTAISKGIVGWLIEIGIFRLGSFFSNSYSIPIYDMIAYSGYKYVLMVITIISSILTGGYISFFVKIYLVACLGVFILKTLRVVMVSDNSANSHHDMHQQHEGSAMRNYFVFGVAMLQCVILFFFN
ncbi:hypothetical protein DFA_05339 [Cavenderia fasciculata]|uniref:Protein YIF1 n=1 Tax=Cavenderia fasciculata TaxID=261658 RepID=F4PKY5_CACFS|nr:uncharacterized protein DFA_05339 [Cavenderia fasciculata]EGG23207.1 hypothetical protein DFA_05339 [Cavenderia fasciculata]|eukprot:XP_004361058.1 hypothetical protein DFA_05339 [Cavenderia fasciculata]